MHAEFDGVDRQLTNATNFSLFSKFITLAPKLSLYNGVEKTSRHMVWKCFENTDVNPQQFSIPTGYFQACDSFFKQTYGT
jgi:hypothetical protein